MSSIKFGFISLAGALIVLLFQAIAGLMKFTAGWTTITIGTVTNGILDEYIEKISSEVVLDWVDFIVNTMELFILLGIIGLVFIIIGSFKKA